MDFHKLKINSNENIDTIAKEYDINREILRNFHNNICSISEIIPKEIPVYLEYIYIPIETFLDYQDKTIHDFKLIAPNFFDKITYGIIYKNNSVNKQIHYTIEVEKLNNSTVIINKNKTYVNNHPVKKIIEELLEKTERAIYPLLLESTTNNSIIRIKNEKEIGERWKKEIKPLIIEYYQSKLTDEIIEKLDSFFLNPNQYFEKIFHHLFYSFYFLPIYTSYPNGNKQSTISQFLNAINQHIHFDVNFKLHKKLTRADKIKLEIRGVENNSLSNNDNKATLFFTYILHKETHKIFSLTGNIICYDENNKQYDLTFEMYELKK
ncbi:hypothetical protein [Empedobacter falsenii]|uniref:LysM domain-containing protein n=1 Tax=Empedobacter falsenii TaxID=343874 RepID=A0AAW7DGJ0_9FLAO|nr:hypothetical protein [Empedobacter falsenii]MDM1551094.1 hypothetical protein [Empedobacter falsenii]